MGATFTIGQCVIVHRREHGLDSVPAHVVAIYAQGWARVQCEQTGAVHVVPVRTMS